MAATSTMNEAAVAAGRWPKAAGRAAAVCLAASVAGCEVGPAAGTVTALLNGKDLAGWKVLRKGSFERAGRIYVKDGQLILEAGQPLTGLTWTGAFPSDGYEVSLEAMRVEGSDFFCGMTFPAAGGYGTLIVGGWGGQLVGISNIDGKSAEENDTTRIVEFKDRRWYHIDLRVARGRIEVRLDGKELISLATAGKHLAVWKQQEPVRPFGLTTWWTVAALRDIRLRRL